MEPLLQDETIVSVSSGTVTSAAAKKTMSTSFLPSAKDLQVSFSHVQLYVDRVESLDVYKKLEDDLNHFHARVSSSASPLTVDDKRRLWEALTGTCPSTQASFSPHNRDAIKQLMVGFGFRVTGYRIPEEGNDRVTTRSFLVTSRDLSGVQIVVTASASAVNENLTQDDYIHFDVGHLRQFFYHHANRQGIAVLGFAVNDVDIIRRRYQSLHPNLVHSYHSYEKQGGGCAKVLQVFAYYCRDVSSERDGAAIKQPDKGTLLRFVEVGGDSNGFCILPGLEKLDTVFDSVSQPAYCDHWVSNVFSRTEFISTLEDTLGFTPKVDFNAGVVAAGEAQIESTVTGNSSLFETGDKVEALRDQSQIFLPINNALSKVGHVHGFLEEIGQGVQHVASRVDNLVEFVERCNRIREITGEGFTFLKIPRSYYGVLTWEYLEATARIPKDLARSLLEVCERNHVVSIDGAVDLSLERHDISAILDSAEDHCTYEENKEAVVDAILSSRYRNVYALLRHHVSETTYMGIVRNQILVDVQGEDILYQIFTSNILQRNPGEEAPFFEFIQRVCSECQSDNGCPVKIKPGCGGFGIRNFLTLFLSIEVSKAMREAAEAKHRGDDSKSALAQKQVDCFTSQLNDSNPILTEISDAMTDEGRCVSEIEAAILRGEEQEALAWTQRMDAARQRKQEGNEKLMACSAQYEAMMRSIREASE